MAETVPPIDYTSRDAPSIRDDMIRVIPNYAPEWTDHNASDPGVAILNILAGKLDALHYYVDRMAAESFRGTCVKRESMVKIMRLLGYELRSVVPASADVVFSFEAQSAPFTIPAGTKVQTVAAQDREPVIYETTADVVVPALATTAAASVVEGETSGDDVGVSTGANYQSFDIEDTIIVEGSLQIYVDEGAGEVLWSAELSGTSAGTDTHYRLERNADDTITIYFGDGDKGKVPAPTATIRAVYRLIQGDRGGAGVYGNVGAGKIRVVVDTILSDVGTRITAEVTNALSAAGGEPRETLEEARRNGPDFALRNQRVVTPSDYKSEAESFGGIAKARVLQGTSGDPCCACNLNVYVAPTGGGVASTALKDDLLACLETKKMVGTCLEIQDPTYVNIDVAGTAYIASNADLNTVRDLLVDQIAEYFSLDNPYADFGLDLILGELFAFVIPNVDGLNYIDFDQVTRQPVAELDTWNGDGAFSAITVYENVKAQTWTVTFISETEFSVQGSRSGIQANGVLDSVYTSDDNEISFQISSGANPNLVGDLATFETSNYFGNVPIGSTEIMQQGRINLTYVVVPSNSSASSC